MIGFRAYIGFYVLRQEDRKREKSDEINQLSNDILHLSTKNSTLLEENLNYQKVSLVKSLNTQLHEPNQTLN